MIEAKKENATILRDYAQKAVKWRRISQDVSKLSRPQLLATAYYLIKEVESLKIEIEMDKQVIESMVCSLHMILGIAEKGVKK